MFWACRRSHARPAFELVDEVRTWISRIATETSGATRVVRSYGRLRGAADVFREIGALDDEALARLRAAEQLVAEGRRSEADES